jgi:hypothetical protein
MASPSFGPDEERFKELLFKRGTSLLDFREAARNIKDPNAFEFFRRTRQDRGGVRINGQ